MEIARYSLLSVYDQRVTVVITLVEISFLNTLGSHFHHYRSSTDCPKRWGLKSVHSLACHCLYTRLLTANIWESADVFGAELM